MSLFRRKPRTVPGLNTASLPDLIFTVLFFFMIVTVMRTADSTVDIEKPQATQLDKTKKTPLTYYIYIGRNSEGQHILRMNGKTVAPADIEAFMREERTLLSPEELQEMRVNIVADRNTRMAIVNEVKRSLRTNHPIKIIYSAQE